jgi:hypothetical protein
VDGGHAKGLRLRRIQRSAVAAAFDEGNARLHRISRQCLKREDEGSPHQSMDDQPVPVRIDVWNAGVATFEVKPRGRDHSIQQVQRRSCRADTLRRRIGRCGNGSHDLVLEPRGLA